MILIQFALLGNTPRKLILLIVKILFFFINADIYKNFHALLHAELAN
jgi:uncharacterized membrane protein (DUF373 family)